MAEWITVKDAANMINVHDRTIRRYISEGKLSARKEGRKVLIDQDSINDLIISKDHRQGIGSDQDNVYDRIKFQQEEIEFLRERVKELERQLSDSNQKLAESNQRHDTVVMQMSRLVQHYQQPFWRKWFQRKALPAPEGEAIVDVESDDEMA